MANDHAATLSDFAGKLNTQFDSQFSRRGIPGRATLMLSNFHGLDERTALQMIAATCDINFAILGAAFGKKMKPLTGPKPLRESLQVVLDDFAEVCGHNFGELR